MSGHALVPALKRLLRGLPAFLLIAASFVAHAAAHGAARNAAHSPGTWVSLATERNLAADPEWLALGHYTGRFLRKGYRSYADDDRFFLDGQGDTDPARELTATLNAFFDEPDSQCRFVARRGWLVTRLPGLGEALPPTECPEFDEWRAVMSADRVVLVFAASYLNSPSSMYGHTFLRFDSAEAGRSSSWLSYALNFGATVPEGDNSMLYAYRGLAGGYPGRFAAAPYFEKLREYSRLENRDLWEYSLNLTPAEVDRMLQHVWELRDIVFDYYFFDENCSMRLLELLDVARPGHALAEMFPHYAIPIDTVRAVRDAGMVEGVDYRPANLTVFEYQVAGLSDAERRLALRLSEDPAVIDNPKFLALPPARRREVADVAYSYLRYQAAGQPRQRERVTQSLALLRLVNELPMPDAVIPPPRPVQPDHGHETVLAAAAVGVEDTLAFIDLEWRISYHDLLDDAEGHPANASLNMGRFILRTREGGTLQLQRLDVIEITSLAPRDEFLKPLSWRVNFGLDRQWTDGDDVLTTQVNGGAGWTFTPAGTLTVSGLVTGRLEYNPHKRGELDLAPGLALIASLGSRWGRTQFGAEAWHFMDGTERTVLSLAHNLSLRRNLALRFSLDRRTSDSDRINEGSVALRYYF